MKPNHAACLINFRCFTCLPLFSFILVPLFVSLLVLPAEGQSKKSALKGRVVGQATEESENPSETSGGYPTKKTRTTSSTPSAAETVQPLPEVVTPSLDDEPATPASVGRKAAQKYMGVQPNKAGSRGPSSTSSSAGSASHYLALHVGTYLSDDAYRWGPLKKVTDVGKLNAGVTYRVGEWVNSMDLAFRMEVSTFELPTGNATKFSVLPIFMFPDATSRFPIYFGVGVGLGVLTKQLDGESSLAVDYQLLLGARLLNMIESTGFFVEAGIKNHLHLLSDGQFNGTFITVGSVFTF